MQIHADAYAIDADAYAIDDVTHADANAVYASFPTKRAKRLVYHSAGGKCRCGPAAEESYVENIIRMNRGKMATFYMTYENNREWNAKIFRGVIEAAGRDHIIISDPSTGMRYLLLTLNLDYVTFEGPINYSYTFQGVTITNTTPTTRNNTYEYINYEQLSPMTTATLGTTTLGREQV